MPVPCLEGVPLDRLSPLPVRRARGLAADLMTPAAFQRFLAPGTAAEKGAPGRYAWDFAVPACEIETPPLTDHVIALHLGGHAPVTRSLDGRTERRSMNTGAVTIIPALQRSSWLLEGPVEFAQAYLPPRLLRQAWDEIGTGSAATPQLEAPFAGADPLLAQLLRALLETTRSGDPLVGLYIDSLQRVLTLHLLRGYTTRSIALAPPPSNPPASLAHALDFIEANLDRPIGLAELAAVAGLSLFHFATVFRRAVGQTPHRYVMERRLRKARHLLGEGDLPIIEVAAACGFASPSHFATAFRRLGGSSPRAYRQQARR